MVDVSIEREKKIRDELAQYYYGMDYDNLPKDKREHIDTQRIMCEEGK